MYGWSMSRLPTSPEELASPSSPPERRSSRAVPTPLPATIDDVGLLPLLLPVAVDVDRAGGEAVPVRRDLPDAGAGDELRAVRESLRPHGRVGRALRALRAAPHARPRALAAGEVADLLGADRVRGRPPVPVELVHALGGPSPDRADRERRQERRRPGRVVGVAAHAGDLHLLVDLLVVRLHLLVGDGPVVGDPVQRPELVVLRAQPHPLGAEVNRAAADGVVHHRRDRGPGDLERVVRRVLPRVRVRAPLRVGDELPLELVPGEVRGVLPAALLEADDLEAGLGEVPRRDRAAGPRADDDDVGLLAVAGDRERERRGAARPGSGGGGGVVLIGPRSSTGSSSPSRRSYSASSEKGGRLPCPG